MNSLIRTILAVASIGLGIAGSANATPVTYTFSGNANGYWCVVCDGSDDTDLSPQGTEAAFTFVVTADTTAVDTSGTPYSRLNSVQGTFTEGSFSATLTGVSIVANADSASTGHNIDFYNNLFSNGLGLSDPALIGYDLLSSIGPIQDTDSGAYLTPTFGGGFFTTTGSDSLYLTINDSLTFAADVARTSVPEPATIALLGLGLASIGFMRGRKASCVRAD